MQVFVCLAGTKVRVCVEADADGTVGTLENKALIGLRAEGADVKQVSLRLPGSSQGLGDSDTPLQDTVLEHGVTVEAVASGGEAPRRRDRLPAVSSAIGTSRASGPLGEPFDDKVPTALWGRVIGIEIVLPGPTARTATARGIALTYANGVRVSHGTVFLNNSTTGRHIDLEDDERVVGVRGWCGKILHEVTFVTNKREHGPYGMHANIVGATKEFCVDFGAGKELMYIHGFVAQGKITEIGFGYGRPVKVPLVHRTPLHTHSYCAGIADDSEQGVHLHSRICGVSVWVGQKAKGAKEIYISGFGFAYTDGSLLRHSQLISTDDLGNPKHKLHTVAFDENEYITGAESALDKQMDTPFRRITFTTNKRTLGPFGSSAVGDNISVRSEVFDGELLFVFTRSAWLSSIGFGHGKPPSSPKARAVSKEEVETAMRLCETAVQDLGWASPRRCQLLDYLPQKHKGAPARKRVTGADTECGCTVC
eukprot:TRINITY_DN43427_c0_g1_i1.p1 TRINITY_DN43427_c0_g1~~TRINITY_DN43427_c0_g1_i1.p1  ORF type:complete len:491 (+),score=93.97 TRINITY_DN43427_c0_g1_i1:36-1475(+)